MHIRTLGGVASFTIQIAAGAATVMVPEAKQIATVIFWLATIGLAASIMWWFLANFRRSSIPHGADIIQFWQRLGRWRKASHEQQHDRDWNLPQAFEYWAQVTDGAGNYIDEFQQAAADGVISIWGKRNGSNSAVYERIPKEHWFTSRLDIDPIFVSTTNGLSEDFILERSKTVPRDQRDSHLDQYWRLKATSSEIKRLWPMANT